MSNHKRRYTRAELTQRTKIMGVEIFRCVLCHSSSGEVTHNDTCVFADASVSSVIVIKSRANIVFQLRQNSWWWVSAASGKAYHIEKLPGRYQMFDTAGNSLVERRRLCDIRLNLVLNQGRY